MIRILILVLALTASRANFPLLKAFRSSEKSSSGQAAAGLTTVPKKYEGVSPSRRQLETRRANRLVMRSSNDVPELSPPGPCADLDLTPRFSVVRNRAQIVLRDSCVQPAYLQPFLQAAVLGSVAPPA
ncbi:MAG: hypothetical protein HY293_00490 [Planctomycetes bacterium]|nr:hypothetical protein [Planctomycetota bacterium]